LMVNHRGGFFYTPFRLAATLSRPRPVSTGRLSLTALELTLEGPFFFYTAIRPRLRGLFLYAGRGIPDGGGGEQQSACVVRARGKRPPPTLQISLSIHAFLGTNN